MAFPSKHPFQVINVQSLLLSNFLCQFNTCVYSPKLSNFVVQMQKCVPFPVFSSQEPEHQTTLDIIPFEKAEW